MGKQTYPVTEQIYVNTPLIESVPLRKFSAGRKVFLKLENCQPSGSFKQRGISALCKYAQSQGFTEVVCSSGGNAGLATAYAAMQLAMSCHIVVTRGTPSDVCERIRSFGATVEICGDYWEDANQQAIKLTANSAKSYLVHPFDHPVLWQGHSTMVDEIAADLGSAIPSIVVTSCGGGGLVCGLVEGIRRHNWQDKTKILVLEPVGNDSFNHAVKAGGEPTRLEKITSVVTCLSANQVCDQILEDFKRSKPPVLSRLVTDQDAVESCIKLANDHRFLVGTACGTALSALYKGIVERILNNDEEEHETIYDKVNNLDFNHCNRDGPVVVVVCGGSEITLDSLNELRKQFNC